MAKLGKSRDIRIVASVRDGKSRDIQRVVNHVILRGIKGFLGFFRVF